MAENRYFWLRLHDDFFSSKRIKKLRKLAGGDTYTIIYLKMQLLALKTSGIIKFTGLEKTVAEEIALDIDEAPEDVGVTMNYLMSVGLIETSDNIDFLLPYVIENTGTEGSSAKRMRELRERKKALPSHCDEDVTEVCEHRYGKIEKEIEIDKEIDININKSKRFVAPTITEVETYVAESGLYVDANAFVDFYESKNWMVGKNKMKDWKAACRNWSRNERNRQYQSRPKSAMELAWEEVVGRDTE